MRIIAGIYKNRVLPYVKKANYKPTTSKVREAIFSILSSGEYQDKEVLKDKNILDLFAGTGIFAFEALSRGAAHATLVDINQKHLDSAKQFADKIGANSNTRFIRMDASMPLRDLRDKYDLVFLDPPYEKGLLLPCLENLKKHQCLNDGAIICLEMSKREELVDIEGFTIKTKKLYGNSRLIVMGYNEQK